MGTLAPRVRRRLSARRFEIWKMAAEHGLFGLAPLLASLLTLRSALAANVVGIDFVHSTWAAGRSVLLGRSPYLAPGSLAVRHGLAFVYPATAALLSVPFGLLAHVPATVIFIASCAVAVVCALRLLGVRDWRVYGVAFLWPAVTSGLQTGNLTLPIVVAIAAMWRWRDRPIVAGTLLALVVSAKIFVWPLAFWLLATRRVRALGWSLAVGAILNAAAWSILGVGQLPRFVRVSSANARARAHLGYSVPRLLGGSDHSLAVVLALALAAMVIAFAFLAARRGHEVRAFALCVLACLVGSPLVWLHYFALLLVPLALLQRRLSAWWLVPVVLSFPISAPAVWQVVVALCVAAAVTVLPGRQPPPLHRSSS